jgi:DNA-binding CsgD family transcriptional regulator/tetratricopeptide (TPR) repeat protein
MTTLLVTGTAGIGVSRLLDETERRVSELPEPFTVIRCSTRAGRWGEPYAPVVAGFGPLLAAVPDERLAGLVGPGAEPLSRLFPQLEPRLRRLGLLPDRPWVVPPERRQARLLEAVLGCLERLGEHSPVILALEDLHVADVATRALATFLARITRPGRVCVLVTYQPDELTRDHPLRADLAAMAEATDPPERLELGPLGRDDLAALVEAIEGERPSAAALLLVAERSGGNPLVAEELIAARRELSGVSLAVSFEQVVAARLGQRRPECRRVLRLLGAAAEPLTAAELASVAEAYEALAEGSPPRSSTAPRRATGVLDADLAAGLAEAGEHGYVDLGGRPVSDLVPDDAIPLRHELVARAIVADLLPGQRRRYAAALGLALRDRPMSRARHLLAAHDPAAAQSAALEAAERAATLDAPGDELAALELAIELEAPAADADGRREAARVLTRAAEAAFASDRADRAVAYAGSAIARLGQRADRVELGLLHDRLGRFLRVQADHEASLDAHRRAVELVPRGPARERAVALAGLAQALMLDGQFGDAERVAAEAIATARAVGEPARAEEGHALCTLGIAKVWSDDPKAALDLLASARGVAEDLGRVDDQFRAIANLTTALGLLGRRGEAVHEATRAIELARAVGLEAVYGNFLRGNIADILFFAGRWQESRAMSRTALEWSPGRPAALDAEVSLAMVEIESAADQAAARLLGRLLLVLETLPDPQDVGPASRAAASFALWRGDVADAQRAADRGWRLVRETEDWLSIGRAAAAMLEVQAAAVEDARERRDLPSIAAARARAAEVLGVAESAVGRAGVAISVGSRRHAEAMLATARAFMARLDGRDDPTTWDALARTWEADGDPYQVAKARWRQAQAALSLNDARAGRALARGPLREAVRIASELGAGPLMRELRELAGRALIGLPEPEVAVAADHGDDGEAIAEAGAAPELAMVGAAAGAGATAGAGAATGAGSAAGRPADLVSAFVGPPAPRRRDTFGLSPREREVLALIVDGRTNREIGERLFISQKTVGVHVGNILAKLGVSGRVEAATAALRLGLTDRR